jgi:hypothetical protein
LRQDDELDELDDLEPHELVWMPHLDVDEVVGDETEVLSAYYIKH